MRIVINPVVVDWNVSSENALVDHVQRRKAATDMVLPVLDKRLDRLELLQTDDSRMPVVVKVLVAVLFILFVFVLVKIGGECFPC